MKLLSQVMCLSLITFGYLLGSSNSPKASNFSYSQPVIAEKAPLNSSIDNERFYSRAFICGTEEYCLALIDDELKDVNSDLMGLPLLTFPVRRNFKDVVRKLIERGADVNMRDRFGMIALCAAVEHGNYGMCELLIEMNANIENESNDKLTPLKRAERLSLYKICSLLSTSILKKRKKETTQEESIPFLLTIFVNYSKTICKELKRNKEAIKKIAKIRIKNNDNLTFLHHAVRAGDLELCKLLLDNGAQAIVQSDNGQTPLGDSIDLGYMEITQLLSQYCDKEVGSQYSNANSRAECLLKDIQERHRELNKKSCGWCRKQGDELSFCGRCLEVKYCSPECQKYDWEKFHKKHCQEKKTESDSEKNDSI